MIVIDANVLLYAYDARSPRHAPARAWLERAMNQERDVRIGLASVLAFARLATDPRVFALPLTVETATGHVTSWLARPNVSIAMPADGHWSRLGLLATEAQARGPLLMDAHLATLVAEHGATLITTDRDFARFAGLRFENPIG